MVEAASTDPRALAQQEEQGRQEAERSRVHALDPDFLLALSFAAIVDSLDIILEIFSFLVVPKILGLVLDALTLFILGAWLYWRTGKLAKSKQRTGGLQKTAARGPLRKVFMRLGLTTILEAIPFLGIFFTWTVMIILTLREK